MTAAFYDNSDKRSIHAVSLTGAYFDTKTVPSGFASLRLIKWYQVTKPTEFSNLILEPIVTTSSRMFQIGKLSWSKSSAPLIMGIVNVTPDSFSDGGKHDTTDAAINHAMKLADEKADILDIGGESTRPGAAEVTTAQELDRILPVIKQLSNMTAITISIDTYKATVARSALDAGATIVNDVWGLQREPEIANVAADHNATVVINHWEQDNDPTIDIIDRLKKFYDQSIIIAHKAGITDDRIVLDPGIGFGKNVNENLTILDRQAELTELGYPLLIGTSRKSFLGILLGKEPDKRLFGTIATNVLATQRGAAIFRVHDVAAHKDAIRVTHAILSQAVDAGSGKKYG